MAKIKMSSIGITNISGKAGGSIYSKNKGGTYFKNFAVPTNVNSTAQQAVRANFGGLSQSWSGLSEGDRGSWNSLAPTVPYTDVFGDQKYLTGFGLYMKKNGNLLASEQATIDFAEVLDIQTILSLDNFAPKVDGLGVLTDFSLDVTFFGETLESGAVILEATPALSASVTNVDNLYRQIATETYASGVTSVSFAGVNTANAYSAKFGNPPSGKVIHVRARAVNSVGDTSTKVSASTAVTVNP